MPDQKNCALKGPSRECYSARKLGNFPVPVTDLKRVGKLRQGTALGAISLRVRNHTTDKIVFMQGSGPAAKKGVSTPPPIGECVRGPPDNGTAKVMAQ
jgi:hypothetical protein